MLKAVRMFTVGVLLAVFFGMLPKEEPRRGYSSPTSSSCPSFFGATSALCHEKKLEKVYMVLTIGSAACSNIAVHGKTAKPHTDETLARI